MTHEAAASVGEPPRLLLVEDDEETLAIAAYFEAFGYAVDTAARASEALAAAEARRPDLLVTDIRLDGSRSGLEVVAELRARWPELPVIVLTGLPNHELERRRDRLNGSVLMRKPVRLLALAERVERLLGPAAAREHSRRSRPSRRRP